MSVPNQPTDHSLIPEVEIRLTSAPVSAAPRKLKMKVSTESARDLRDLWGGHEGVERSAVDRLAAVGRGEEDPGQWIIPPNPSVEVGLVERMAAEMSQAIDQEIRDA